MAILQKTALVFTIIGAIVWGIYGLITTYIIKPYIDKIIKLIPKDLTYISILILALDIIITIITK